ncbi:MAG: hypothetical protein EPO06_12060 [Burkholderiaceae bacterium]|nr:MAG: hypothetical protein EPO06_12060 [Burkholderiaceae bacterium]
MRAYVSWGVWGPARVLRCLVDESMTRTTKPGAVVSADVRLFAAPGAVCPPGSLVTLPDGRRGYATGSVNHDGGGLPTPDHVEIAVAVGSVLGVPFGETVTVLTRTVTGRDGYGNDVYGSAETEVEACAVRILSSTESRDKGADKVVDSIEVIMPPASSVTAADRLRVRGVVYAVDGRPEPLTDPMTGADPGLRVIAKRTTG